MNIYVVTNVEMGWDCVCGVFSTLDKLIKYFMEGSGYGEDITTLDELKGVINECYVIHEEVLH